MKLIIEHSTLILFAKLLLSLCILLRLYLGAQGEHLISQLSWVFQLLDYSSHVWVCHVCLPSRWVNPCVLCPLMIGLKWWFCWQFFKHDEYGFSSVGRCCHSRESVWNSRANLCCIASGKSNPSRVSLQKFEIRYIIF